jgi:hypothetical protein
MLHTGADAVAVAVATAVVSVAGAAAGSLFFGAHWMKNICINANTANSVNVFVVLIVLF